MRLVYLALHHWSLSLCALQGPEAERFAIPDTQTPSLKTGEAGVGGQACVSCRPLKDVALPLLNVSMWSYLQQFRLGNWLALNLLKSPALQAFQCTRWGLNYNIICILYYTIR